MRFPPINAAVVNSLPSTSISFLAFEVLYWTGIRGGELFALAPSDFELKKKLLPITRSYQ